MSDLKVGKEGKIMRNIEPAITLQSRIGLIQAGVLIICCRLRIQLEIEAVLLPESMGAQGGFKDGRNIRALCGVRGEHIAVVEPAGHQLGIEHP